MQPEKGPNVQWCPTQFATDCSSTASDISHDILHAFRHKEFPSSDGTLLGTHHRYPYYYITEGLPVMDRPMVNLQLQYKSKHLKPTRSLFLGISSAQMQPNHVQSSWIYTYQISIFIWGFRTSSRYCLGHNPSYSQYQIDYWIVLDDGFGNLFPFFVTTNRKLAR